MTEPAELVEVVVETPVMVVEMDAAPEVIIVDLTTPGPPGPPGPAGNIQDIASDPLAYYILART